MFTVLPDIYVQLYYLDDIASLYNDYIIKEVIIYKYDNPNSVS